MENLRIDHEQIQKNLEAGHFVVVEVYGDKMTLCAQYGKFNLLSTNEFQGKKFDTFHEMCSQLCLFSEEARVLEVQKVGFEEDEV